MVALKSSEDNEHPDTVECQLCFDRIRVSDVLEHLKNLHHVADSAIYNNKPLKSWIMHV